MGSSAGKKSKRLARNDLSIIRRRRWASIRTLGRLTMTRIGIRCRQQEQEACTQRRFNRPSPSLGFDPNFVGRGLEPATDDDKRARGLHHNHLFICSRGGRTFTRTPGRSAATANDDDKDWDPVQARKARGLHAMTFQSSVAVAGLRSGLWVD